MTADELGLVKAALDGDLVARQQLADLFEEAGDAEAAASLRGPYAVTYFLPDEWGAEASFEDVLETEEFTTQQECDAFWRGFRRSVSDTEWTDFSSLEEARDWFAYSGPGSDEEDDDPAWWPQEGEHGPQAD